MKGSILFICSANICRSPMAEGLFRAMLGPEAAQWRVESAGVWALPGYAAAANTLRVLQKRNIDLSLHLARQVTPEMASAFNLILTMEHNHKEALQAAFSNLAGRVFLLTEMAGKKYDIADPIGLELSDFEATAQELEGILARGMERIRLLAGGSPA